MGDHVTVVDNSLDARDFLAIDDYIALLYSVFLKHISMTGVASLGECLHIVRLWSIAELRSKDVE